jgi:hypothetical protein
LTKGLQAPGTLTFQLGSEDALRKQIPSLKSHFQLEMQWFGKSNQVVLKPLSNFHHRNFSSDLQGLLTHQLKVDE